MKRYVVCGVSNRAISMFIGPIVNRFSAYAQVVGLLDIDLHRADICKMRYPALQETPVYLPEEFDKMIQDLRPDVVIVTGRDDTHAHYIIQALKHDLDVITEKPMATTAADSRRIMQAEAESKGKVTVSFNYRYNPIHTKIKELMLEGKVGRVTSIDLNWYIDTFHGSSYFQRWNRQREHSGGLSIHKGSHHFDLINWWIEQRPVEVFAAGALNYFGPDGEGNPEKVNGRFCGTCNVKSQCNYYTRWNNRMSDSLIQDDHLGKVKVVPIDQEYHDYRRDACMYDANISTEDTYAAVVRYDKGAILSYSVNFSLPYEGYRLAINGTKGRIETQEYHAPSRIPFPVPVQTIDYFPLFGSKETIHVVQREGGHGGGDPVLLEDLFLGVDSLRPYRILSGSSDGAYAVTTGEAVWKSIMKGQPIAIGSLLEMDAKV
jgi:predicted dehydrogenase